MVTPDSSSNDYIYHEQLNKNNAKIIVLDHHEAEKISPYAIVINNQLSDYPNKQLSGVGVTWQFCRYIDLLLNEHFSNNYLDLVALGLTGDMQSLLSLETKHLINKGFKTENIHNPFIYHMWEKNKFKLGDEITPWGATFYIVPLVNAITRSATMEEKKIVFQSMLNHKSFESISSTKRGHKGENEPIVEQAIRICANVKNRQTKAISEAEELLNKKIVEEDLLKNKVLLLLLQPNCIDKNIAGLIANKLMAKYQRPCCVLTKTSIYKDEEDIPPWEPAELASIIYQGSARGCDLTGIKDFKSICEQTQCIDWALGHPGAFGLSIPEENIELFIEKTNALLKDINTEPIYFVDYIFQENNVDEQIILDIAGMNNFWGQGIQESLIVIESVKVTEDMLTLMSPDKSPTLKIKLSNISLIKFGSSQEEYESLLSRGYVEINIIGKCNANNWNGYITPQILIEDYEIIDKCKYYF